jgi:RNA polymerase sigma-70 factor (ECF subfamily)
MEQAKQDHHAVPDLLSRAENGDMFAFEALVERFRDDLYTFGLRMTRSATDAVEIAQQSFLSAYLHLTELRNEAEFGAWLFSVAASHATIRVRLRRRVPTAEEELKLPKCQCGVLGKYPRVAWSVDSHTRPLNAELRRAVEDATDRLPQGHREVFLFKDLAGLSYQQIANIRGESIRAIKERLHQTRLSLRETLDRFYNRC